MSSHTCIANGMELPQPPPPPPRESPSPSQQNSCALQRFRFNDASDARLLEYILRFEPYDASYGTRATCWDLVRDGMRSHANDPNSHNPNSLMISSNQLLLTSRACRDRFKIIMTRTTRQRQARGYCSPDQAQIRSIVKQIKKRIHASAQGANTSYVDPQADLVTNVRSSIHELPKSVSQPPGGLRHSSSSSNSLNNHVNVREPHMTSISGIPQFNIPGNVPTHHGLMDDDNPAVVGNQLFHTSPADMENHLSCRKKKKTMTTVSENTRNNENSSNTGSMSSSENYNSSDETTSGKSSSSDSNQSSTSEVIDKLLGEMHGIHESLRELLDLERSRFFARSKS